MPSLECRLINACVAAYAIKNGALPADNPNLKKLDVKAGTTPAVFTSGADEINAGFLAQTSDDWVVLTFRGTLPPFHGDFWAWVRDWLQDFEAGPTDWVVGGRVFGEVETGFADAVKSLWPQVETALNAIDLGAMKGIIVTGHSKGAAMVSLAASILKSAMPHILVEACAFAAPLVADRTFVTNYDALGIRPFSVRYQNEYDLVPFLPYWPAFALLAAAERRSTGGDNQVVTADAWPSSVENDYVPIGILRYLGPNCVVEYGEKAENDAWTAIKHALEHFEFEKIVDAHSADGRYLHCVCSG